MTGTDEWGRDPSVQRMRRLFRAMEEAQASLLDRLRVSPFDFRLRSWREGARIAFESACGRAARAGVDLEKEETAGLYLRCLVKIMNAEGLEVPKDILPQNARLERILEEDFS